MTAPALGVLIVLAASAGWLCGVWAALPWPLRVRAAENRSDTTIYPVRR